MEVNSSVLWLTEKGTDFLDRLNDTSFIVDGHDGNDGSVGTNGGFEFGKGDKAISLNGEIGDVESFFLQLST